MNTKLPITREEAINLLKGYEQTESDWNHYLESEAIMRALAERFAEKMDYWGMLGLLHDVDWGITKKDWEKHCVEADKILKEKGFDADFIRIVQSHGWNYEAIPAFKDKIRTEKIEHALTAAETITGLIYAYALMRGKDISGMDVAGLKKKFKDKRFAANCNRELIREIEKTGMQLDEFFQLSIDAIKKIKEEIGLK